MTTFGDKIVFPAHSNARRPPGVSLDVSEMAPGGLERRDERVELQRDFRSDPEEWHRIGRVKAGDVSAFEELYRSHCGRVYALCLRMSGDVSRADELTQEVFVRAWEKLSSFRGESRFSSWLVRVAINVVLSDQRRRGRQEERQVELAAGSQAEHRPHPALQLDLERAIASLPAGARTVFLLHEVEGYRHHEIAELTQSAVGTCKAQLHRARRLLREALKR
jgi:RNA polymerase sigma-70 factor (ECF subfamily)